MKSHFLFRKRSQRLKITRQVKVFFNTLVIASLFCITLNSSGFARSNNKPGFLSPNLQAQSLVDQLTPQERIGQLFLISLNGSDASAESAIEQLISKYHIGGVILNDTNDNFSTDPDILQNTLNLTRQLQQTTWKASQVEIFDETSGEAYKPYYIPLFIGISQEGDGFPYDQIFNGLTPLPNSLTIGSTWQTEFASQTGATTGRELSALGFNLLLAPSLDILETPHPESEKDMGSRTFGGDPFWVSVMGQAYIEGVHQGSNNKIAVVSKHFPGYGSADRIPEEEIATIRRSLSELRGFDLIPFFAVTGNSPSPASRTDAILTSHIRFQGFQESSPRATTRPISLDQSTLLSLLGLPEIQTWIQDGGVVITDDLGNKAMRSYLDLNSQQFDPERITLNALLAGNDIVYISDFSSQEQPDGFTAAIETFEFLIQKYREDPAFAQRVDDAVLRIISLKYRLYGSFLESETIPPETIPAFPEDSSQLAFTITRNAATLLNPTQAELDEILPDPPKRTDRITFVTDVRNYQQCSKCPTQSWMEQDALQNVVLRRYGPTASRQVVESNLSSFSMAELDAVLNNQLGGETLARKIALSHWVVFSLLDNSEEYPSYDTLSRFLAKRPDLIQGKRIIVFSFNAPYFLDSTDISKLTAYYALYNKTPQAVEMAAYLLFDELPALSAPSVSVPGINYSLNKALFPDPDQIIPLEFDLPEENTTGGIETTTPAPPPIFSLGDMVSLRTGVIVDSNGRAVPDGTPVEFTLSIDGAPPANRQTDFTINGIARTSFLISNNGILEYQAQSEQAVSNPIIIELPRSQNETATPPTPTPEPTATPEPSPTPTFTPEPTSIPYIIPEQTASFNDWIIAIMITMVLGWTGYRLAISIVQARWGIRMGFLIVIGGLISYSYIILKLPGSGYLNFQLNFPRCVSGNNIRSGDWNWNNLYLANDRNSEDLIGRLSLAGRIRKLFQQGKNKTDQNHPSHKKKQKPFNRKSDDISQRWSWQGCLRANSGIPIS